MNRQPSVEDVDDPADNPQCVFPRNPRNIVELDDDDDEAENGPTTSQGGQYPPYDDDEDEVEGVEQPEESAEAELSK